MHKSVLTAEVLELLDPKPGEIVLDGTVGAAGHSEAFLQCIGPKGQLIGLDRDPEAIRRADERLKALHPNARWIQANFADIDQVLNQLGIGALDIIFIDIGFSSDQLADKERGFSFQTPAFLDMRMDPEAPLTAFEVVNQYPEVRLADVLYQYGEERKSRQIAAQIVRKRRSQVLKTTQDIVDIVNAIYGSRRGKIHPATRTFQALRIEVNQELESLKVGLSKFIACLKPGGRLGVISFHSLEDRIVKHQFVEWKKSGIIQLLTSHVVTASREEVKNNPRSRSAKLRVCKKI